MISESILNSSISQDRRNVPALDGVRGLAILLVVFSHYTTPFLPPVLLQITWGGWRGVDLFFVLSGFLITGILLDTKNSEHYFRNFFIRRILRIFPLYYGVLICIFGIIPFFVYDNSELFSIQGWLWTYLMNWKLTFVNNWVFSSKFFWLDHFWTLAIEEQFYLFWPFLVWRLSAKHLMQTCIALSIIAFLLRIFFLNTSDMNHLAPLTFTPCRIDCLALGGLASILIRKPIQPSRRTVKFIFIFTTSLIILTSFVWSRFADPANLLFSSTLTAICGSSLILFVINSKPHQFLKRFFELRILHKFGKYSYGIYIYNWMLYPLVNDELNRFLPSTSYSTACVRLIAATFFSMEFRPRVGIYTSHAFLN